MFDQFILILFFIISFIGTYLVRKIVINKSIIDIPNSRSSHDVPTPRGGGLAIAVSWYLFLILWFAIGRIQLRLFLALFSSIVLVIVSFIDDVKDLPPRLRLFSQVISSILGLLALNGFHCIDIGFKQFEFPFWINLFVLGGIIWMINLFNFMDGSDGYLGMEGVFIFASFFIFSGDFMSLMFAIIIFGFLLWNWPKAKIFCGDVGSTLIGYTFIIYAIYYQNTHQTSFLISLILSGLFWGDASITLFRRWKNKETLSIAHKKHAYQRLIQGGYSHKKVLFIGLFINSILFVLSYFSFIENYGISIAFLLQIIIILIYMRFADKKKEFK
jgi:UDP-N-acetylmuramyl pentapeptide phosphotransferase/UDP-N-acetylglucosamine-1-phosphate transferase